MQLRALKTFSAGGTIKVKQGETFTASEVKAKEYMRLKLAEPADGAMPVDIERQLNPIEPDPTYNNLDKNELEEKNLTELKKIAKSMGVSGYSSMNKTELVQAIINKQQK